MRAERRGRSGRAYRESHVSNKATLHWGGLYKTTGIRDSAQDIRTSRHVKWGQIMGIAAAERLIGRGAFEQLLADIDDYCGTGPHPHIPHIPWLREVLVGVAVSRLVATVDECEQRHP